MKIYGGVKGVKVPVLDWSDIDGYKKAVDKYIEDVQKKCKIGSSSEYAGELIQFQVADGYAQYVVASIRPLQLIHLNVMDGYQYPDVELYNEKLIREKVKQQRAMKAFFEKRKSN